MVKKRKAEIAVTASSGNVFADLDFAEPEEELTKAQLASHIRQAIKRRRLTKSPPRESWASTSRRFPPFSTVSLRASPASASCGR
jgi:hypothetical protein